MAFEQFKDIEGELFSDNELRSFIGIKFDLFKLTINERYPGINLKIIEFGACQDFEYYFMTKQYVRNQIRVHKGSVGYKIGISLVYFLFK